MSFYAHYKQVYRVPIWVLLTFLCLSISAFGEEHEGGMQVPRRLGVLRAEDVLAERRPL